MRRNMGDFEVLQRTSDGYFNINALINEWNSAPANTRRRLDDFLNSSTTKRFMKALKADLSNGEISPLTEIEILKIGNSSFSKSSRKIKEVWVHPYLFLKFALWINNKFEVQVIKL